MKTLIFILLTVSAQAQTFTQTIAAGYTSASADAAYFIGLKISDTERLQLGLGYRRVLQDRAYLGHNPNYTAVKLLGARDRLFGPIGFQLTAELRSGEYLLLDKTTMNFRKPMKEVRLNGNLGVTYATGPLVTALCFYPQEYNPRKYLQDKVSEVDVPAVGINVAFNF
jgi:hypothetical protein